LASRIGDGDARLATALAAAQAAGGDHKAAVKTASSIEDDRQRDQAMASVVSEYAATGDYGRALKIAEKIDGKARRSRALAAIARAQAAGGHRSDAKKTL